MRDRGQSEVLGFVLVLGIMLLTISLVLTTGYVGLQNAQEHERTNNAERAFTILATNVDDVTRHGAPSRATEIKLSDARLATGDEIEMRVSGERDSEEVFDETETVHPIVYESQSGAEIVYAGGAVFRQNDGSAVVTREPNFVREDDALIVPIVRTEPAGDESIGVSGHSTVLVRTERSSTDLRYETVDEVTVEITSPRAEAWERYLEEELSTDCDTGTDTVRCTVSTERVYVSIDRIEVAVD